MGTSEELAVCIARYAELEVLLQTLFTRTIGTLCAQCSMVCCRIDLCEEAVDSPFLSAVRDYAGAGERPELLPRDGWLCCRGCGLSFGRPPVCYAFVCEEALSSLSMDLSEALRRLCGQLEELYCECADGVDLHRVGLENLRGETLRMLVEGLSRCCDDAKDLLDRLAVDGMDEGPGGGL